MVLRTGDAETMEYVLDNLENFDPSDRCRGLFYILNTTYVNRIEPNIYDYRTGDNEFLADTIRYLALLMSEGSDPASPFSMNDCQMISSITDINLMPYELSSYVESVNQPDQKIKLLNEVAPSTIQLVEFAPIELLPELYWMLCSMYVLIACMIGDYKGLSIPKYGASIIRVLVDYAHSQNNPELSEAVDEETREFLTNFG